MGFEYLYGHTLPWPGEPNPWISAVTIADRGDAYMLADIVESVTVAPYNYQYTHGELPGDWIANNAPVDDLIEIGVAGSNIARLDGSVTWHGPRELSEHASRDFDGGGWRGWW
jgi:hypothetical protein